MVKKLLLISLLLYISINYSGCTSVIRSYKSNILLKKGEGYANRRQHDRVEEILLEAVKYNPRNTKAWIALGETYFEVEDYKIATYAYLEALRYDRDAFNAYAGLWKVSLEERGYTEETKREVRKEIEDYIDSGDKAPERLMAAFYGLRFLHEYDRASEIAEEIMAAGPNEKIASIISNYVFEEEILREEDIEKRLRMIEDFLRLYPLSEKRYMMYALRMKIAAKNLKDNEMLLKYGEEWLGEEPENRRTNFAVGYRYTEEDVALDKAILYIKKALTMIDNPDPADKPEHYPALSVTSENVPSPLFLKRVDPLRSISS